MVWSKPSEKDPKKEVRKSAGKLMALCILRLQGTFDPLHSKGVNVNSVYYYKVLYELKAGICYKYILLC